MTNGIANQAEFSRALHEVAVARGYEVVEEKDDRRRTTINLANGRRHIADFYLPPLNLYVEFSGRNFMPKVIKMRRAHAVPGLDYFALIDLRDAELDVSPIDSQVEEFLGFLKEGPPACGWTAHSLKRLDALVRRFDEIYRSLS